MKSGPSSSVKRRPGLLVASLILNVALIGLFFTGAVINRGSSTRTIQTEVPSSSAPRAAQATAKSTTEFGSDTWAWLNEGDFATRQARLRALGFPPSLTRSILIAQIRTAHAPRLRELEMTYQRSPYFRPKALDGEAFAEFRALTREENRRIRELLGPDVDSAAAQNIRDALPGTSDEKIAQLTDLMANYAQLRQELSPNTRGTPLTAEERDQMNVLEKNLRIEMAALLTPQELEDYDLRTSVVAGNLRTTLAGIEVSEAEFRTLFRAQSTINSAPRIVAGPSGTFTIGPITPEENRARIQAQQELQAKAAETLGPERFAAYQRAGDFNYRQTAQLVARLSLPPETANHVYTVQQDLQQRAQAIQSNRALTAEDRNAQLSVLTAEAQTKVTAALGAPGYQAYRQYGGNWMAMLQPRPVPPPAVNTSPRVTN